MQTSPPALQRICSFPLQLLSKATCKDSLVSQSKTEKHDVHHSVRSCGANQRRSIRQQQQSTRSHLSCDRFRRHRTGVGCIDLHADKCAAIIEAIGPKGQQCKHDVQLARLILSAAASQCRAPARRLKSTQTTVKIDKSYALKRRICAAHDSRSPSAMLHIDSFELQFQQEIAVS